MPNLSIDLSEGERAALKSYADRKGLTEEEALREAAINRIRESAQIKRKYGTVSKIK